MTEFLSRNLADDISVSALHVQLQWIESHNHHEETISGLFRSHTLGLLELFSIAVNKKSKTNSKILFYTSDDNLTQLKTSELAFGHNGSTARAIMIDLQRI